MQTPGGKAVRLEWSSSIAAQVVEVAKTEFMTALGRVQPS
jgi:hypothetical protein